METTMSLLAGAGVLLFVILAGAAVVLLVVVSAAGLLRGATCLLEALRDRARRRRAPQPTRPV